MLVISRRPEEEVVVKGFGEIKIKVLSSSGNHVRLGFVAPKNVEIHRSEVMENEAEELVSETQVSGAVEEEVLV